MKSLAPTLVLLLLAGCGASGNDPQSEAMIENAAANLEKQADANVNRMIAEIEATAEAPPESAPVEADNAGTGNKAGIENQSADDSN